MNDVLLLTTSVAEVDACHVVDTLMESEIASAVHITTEKAATINILQRAFFKDQTLATTKSLYPMPADLLKSLEVAYDQAFISAFNLWLRKRHHAICARDALHQEAELLGVSYADDLARIGTQTAWKRPESEAERQVFKFFLLHHVRYTTSLHSRRYHATVA